MPTNLLNDLFVGLLWVVCCVSGPPNAGALAAHCVATIQNNLEKNIESENIKFVLLIFCTLGKIKPESFVAPSP